MKKGLYISSIVLLAFVSCAREVLVEDVFEIPEGERMVFSADLGDAVKSTFADDGVTLVWEPSDRVFVMSGKVQGESVVSEPSLSISIDSQNPAKASILSTKKRSYWVGGDEGENNDNDVYSFIALYPASAAGATPFIDGSTHKPWVPVNVPAIQDGVHFGKTQICADLLGGNYTRGAILGGETTVQFNHFQPLTALLNFNMSSTVGGVLVSKIRISSHWNEVLGKYDAFLAGAAAISDNGRLVPASSVASLEGESTTSIEINLPSAIEVGSTAGSRVLAAILPSVAAGAVQLDFEAFDTDGNLRLQGSATSPEAGFLPGNKYTFTVAMHEAETTVLALECLREYPAEGGSYTGRVVSYTYENGERKAVPFAIAFYEDASCTQVAENVGSYDYWIHFTSDPVPSDNEVGVTMMDYGVNANQNINMIAPPQDATVRIRSLLRSAEYLRSQEEPWNLASSIGSTDPDDFSTVSTANSYIVNNPGYYVIPCVVGNGIKDGQPNTEAYIPVSADSGTIFQDYLGAAISNPIVGQNPGNGTPTAAYLLWEDCIDLISTSSAFAPAILDGTPEDVAAAMTRIAPYALELVSSGEGADKIWGIKFEIPSPTIDQGNAVIAVVDDQNRVMWSWHIWVTDYNPYIEANILPVVSYWSNGEYDMMKRNLGWVLTGVSNDVSYGSNYLYVKLWQVDENNDPIPAEDGGKEIVVSLQQLGMTLVDADIQHGYCPYWQAGRKDPFTPGIPITAAGPNKGYLQDITTYGAVKALTGLNFVSENRYGNSSASHTLKDAIQKPWIYFYNYNSSMDSSGWFTDEITNASLWNNLASDVISNLYGGDEYEEGFGLISTIITSRADSHKTIYDPNPVGFVMPSMDAGGTFFAFFTGGKYESYLSDLTDDDVLKERYVSLLISASPYGSSFYASLADKELAESGHANQAKTGFLPQVGRRYHMLDGNFQLWNSYTETSFGSGINDVYEFASAQNCGGYYSNMVSNTISPVLLCSYPNMYFGFLTMSSSALPIRSMKDPASN